MDSYSVDVVPSAEAELRSVPFPFRRQINQRIFKLKTHPRPAGVLIGDDGHCTLRLWSWILEYDVDDAAKRVTILAVQA